MSAHNAQSTTRPESVPSIVRTMQLCDDSLPDLGGADIVAFPAQESPAITASALAPAPTPPPTRERRAIQVNGLELPELAEEAWTALNGANEPPTLFRFGDMLCRIEDGDREGPTLRSLDRSRLSHALVRAASFYKETYSLDGNARRVSVQRPPANLIDDMLADPAPRLPRLSRIVTAPVFSADGILQTEPGYHLTSGIYYAPAPGFVVPPVARTPSSSEVERARCLLLEDLLGDFPFVEASDRAQAVALLVQPFVRELIDGPTPLHQIESPTPGTGKTLLSGILIFPSLGRWIGGMSEAGNEDEWRKRLTAKLMNSPSAILIDNVRRPLDSGALAMALTADSWEDRILGVSDIARLPVRCAWITTGNNPTTSGEIARRCVRIRIDAQVEQPSTRTEFQHRDLRTWVTDHRGELVWAVLTLVQAWLWAGRPAGAASLGSYERWAEVIGGLLAFHDIPDFLADRAPFYDLADAERAPWQSLVAAWWTAFEDREVGVAELFPLAENAGFDGGGGDERTRRAAFGRGLAAHRDQIFSDYQILRGGKRHHAQQWRLRRR